MKININEKRQKSVNLHSLILNTVMLCRFVQIQKAALTIFSVLCYLNLLLVLLKHTGTKKVLYIFALYILDFPQIIKPDQTLGETYKNQLNMLHYQHISLVSSLAMIKSHCITTIFRSKRHQNLIFSSSTVWELVPSGLYLCIDTKPSQCVLLYMFTVDRADVDLELKRGKYCISLTMHCSHKL